MLSSGENVRVSVWKWCKPGTGLPPVQDQQLPVPASARPAGSPGLGWQWDVEEQDRELSLAQGAGQPLSLCCALCSGGQEVWAAASAAGQQAGSWGLRQAMGSPLGPGTRQATHSKAFFNGDNAFMACVLLEVPAKSGAWCLNFPH